MDGSIMAAIIVAHTSANQPRPPRLVPGPMSIPCMRRAVTAQDTAATAISRIAGVIRLSRSRPAGRVIQYFALSPVKRVSILSPLVDSAGQCPLELVEAP